MPRERQDQREIPVVGIVAIGIILLLGMGGISFLILSPVNLGRGLGAILIVVTLLLLLKILYRVPFPESWIIDSLGILIEKKSGFRIIVTLFRIEKIYQKVKRGIQYSIPLYPDQKEVRIDLKIGGEVILKDPRIWIKVNDPLQAVKTAVNFEEQIREIVENRMSGALNDITYEEVMEIRIPKILREGRGIEQVEAKKEKFKEKLDELIQMSEGLKKFLEECNIEFKGFTLDDFDFDESTIKKRGERILTEMGKEIAQNIAEARKNEMKAISDITEILQQAGFQPSLAQQVAAERYQDHLAAEKGTLQKIIWQGGGSIPEIAAQWEAGRRMPMGRPPEAKEPPAEAARKPKPFAEVVEEIGRKREEIEREKRK